MFPFLPHFLPNLGTRVAHGPQHWLASSFQPPTSPPVPIHLPPPSRVRRDPTAGQTPRVPHRRKVRSCWQSRPSAPALFPRRWHVHGGKGEARWRRVAGGICTQFSSQLLFIGLNPCRLLPQLLSGPERTAHPAGLHQLTTSLWC